MDTTLDESTPREAAGAPKVVFNPYLEGHQVNGPVSNCIACHSHAVYRSKPAGYLTDDLAHRLKPLCLLLDPSNSASTPEVFISEDSYFHEATRTHFLWSLAIKQDPTPQSNLRNEMMRTGK